MSQIKAHQPIPDYPRQRHDASLLRILNYYRLTLSLVFISGYFNEASQVFLGLENPRYT